MPFEIVRNDITNMQADAIVNTANPRPAVGSGVDTGIHKKAGPLLLEARKRVGSIGVGKAAITPAFDLDAKYVIHTVGPVWQGGSSNEEPLLRSCYKECLALAKQYGCESIAFPLISTGNYGFPKPLAIKIAVNEFSSFLLDNDMLIYLVVFSRDAFELSEKLFSSVSSYIDENYILDKTLDEYGSDGAPALNTTQALPFKNITERSKRIRDDIEFLENTTVYSNQIGLPAVNAVEAEDWESVLDNIDAGFSETLLHLIDRTGKKDSEIYKRANIDRKLFSKIRNNADYKPSKATALAFAIALELDLQETKDFIARAGFALSHSSKFDIIVEYFIVHKNYDVFELNEVLFAFDQPLIGS